jgi:hypothetical protein
MQEKSEELKEYQRSLANKNDMSRDCLDENNRRGKFKPPGMHTGMDDRDLYKMYAKMETVFSGHDDDVKFENQYWRVLISRMTKADGEVCNNPLYILRYKQYIEDRYNKPYLSDRWEEFSKIGPNGKRYPVWMYEA